MASALLLACAREAVCDVVTDYVTNFNDHVEITFPGFVGNNPYANFPLIVRLSENAPAGFTYDRTDGYGEDIRFLSVENGVTNVAPYEVDTWDTTGESILWVRVPQLGKPLAKGRKLIMYWAPSSPRAIPANDSRAVWDGYTAVWHLNGSVSDATANDIAATRGSAAWPYTGRIGLAMGTRSDDSSGPVLQVPAGTVVDGMTTNAYTITGWLKVNSGTNWLYSAKTSLTDDAFGAQLVEKDEGLALKLHADATTVVGPGDKHFATNEWVHVAVVHSATNGKHTVYVNGEEFYGPDGERTDKAGTQGLAFGGLVGDQAAGTLNGDLDEVRIYPGKRTEVWLANDYAQTVSSDYIAFGTVQSTGKPVYDEEEEEDDPKPPSPESVSPADYAGTAVFVPSGVEEGTVLTNFVTMLTVWEGEPMGFNPSDLPFGPDEIRFFNELGEVLNYELDFWNSNGRSTFWVKLPELSSETRITMCWGLREGRYLPTNDVSEVWTEYAGVWHMTDESDSTTNNAVGSFGPKAVQQIGHLGLAAGTQFLRQNGAILDVEANAAIDALGDEPFTVTAWACLNRLDLKYGTLFSRGSEPNKAWGAQFCGGTTGDSSAIAMETGSSSVTNAVGLDVDTWYRFDFVFSKDRLALYVDGTNVGESAQSRTIRSGTTGKLSIGGLVSTAEGVLGKNTLNGFIDEFRLRPGVPTAEELQMDCAQTSDDWFFTREPAQWDETAILQNRWLVYPTASKTEWKEGDDPAEFTLGEPWYGGTPVLTFQNRSTGEILTEVPTMGGDYRAIFSVPENKPYSSLSYTIEFRIRVYRPTHDLGDGNDRVLVLSVDESISDGKVYAQAYNDTVACVERPYWVHDVDSGYDYTSTSLLYNFCGGLRHTYWSRDGQTRLWDLVDVRYGNTYNNADEVFNLTGDWEEWDDGLKSDQNYLSWNPQGGCLVDDLGATAEGWHEYAAQAVLCNTEKASINSTLYTNGIGTIYFDCVNSHTDDATNGYYKLVLEIATNAVNRSTGIAYGIPTDENIQATHKEYDETLGRQVQVVHDSYKYADWKAVMMKVKLVNGETMTDLETTDELTLDLTGGGSYTNFYRVYAPLNITGNIRFRIRRKAINPNYTISSDLHSLILVDNVICSKPGNSIHLKPRGFYDPTKVMRETVGYEGAFIPSYPSINDSEIYGRAVVSDGGTVDGLSSVVMHYRWRYLNQQYTDWLTVDLNPKTLVSLEPLAWPMLSGDLEYWYEVNQADIFYQYADYSGLDLGLPGYSEEIQSAVSRAETYEQYGLDWYTRVRDGKSTYGEIKLFVRRGAQGAVEPVEMFVARNQIWRGCLQTTNAVSEGLYFRIEGRNKQNDAVESFQFNTNCWFLSDSVGTLPFTSSLTDGTTNDWGWVPCDGATGHLLFQLDESTRALTVAHADWQDFNGWNDAHRDYFSGSSTDDASKKGVSAAQREYSCSCSRWEDDVPTNDTFWCERFIPTGGSYARYDFYAPFESESSPRGFDMGEGMWVRGAYADTNSLSGMAYQMAGQGRGWIQFFNHSTTTPRGIDSVKFNARLAQSVSPDLFAYYAGDDSENPLHFNDYSFVTRAAFDRNANSNFTGNASLSLMAFYTPNGGCYEARWEQLGGQIEDESGIILGPDPRSQRLTLYRWRYEGQQWTATEVLSATNMAGSLCSWKDSLAPHAIPATYTVTNNLMPFYIGAYNNIDEDYTVVIAGVRIAGGTDAKKNSEQGGVRAVDGFSVLNTAGWLYIVYRDDRDDRLKEGTFGLLPSNCEGVFVRPQYHDGIVSWDANVLNTRKLATQVYPAKGSTVSSSLAKFIEANARNCAPGVFGGGTWIKNPGRVDSFLDPFNDNYSGFTNQVVSQTVDLYTAEIGTTSWTDQPVASCTLTGFGKPGSLQSVTNSLWTSDNLSIRLRAGGKITSIRNDVVIDNIQISQWAGQDWLGLTSTERTRTAAPTNFVYTMGWITDGALQLSPRRAIDDYPCSLRVPLCDGLRGGDSLPVRGLGLGSLSIRYRNAQTNACLLVQIATNGVSAGNLRTYTLDPGTTSGYWTTITNWDFSVMTDDERAGGVLECSPGLHGTQGVGMTMRILVDPTLRDKVRATDDPTAFGSVEIVEALFRDEPPLDKSCWWGFNIRTIGDQYDVEQRMYLPDNPMRRILPPLDEYGMSFALNNSVTDQCDTNAIAEAKAKGEDNPFREHMPFLQTPAFASNLVGEVSFRARKYSLQQGSQNAEVTLFGTRNTDYDTLKDTDWDALNIFIVSNTTFETYRYKTDTSEGYKVFRFAVTGVRGVKDPGDKPVSGDEPVRVLLDDVLVSEAVRARLAFRNVGAFRHYLDKTTYVPNVPSATEQPICGEGWGVQTEVYATMLGDEIDSSTPPRVRLYWFTGTSPWGYEQWKDRAAVRNGWLTQATDTNNFYRSSMSDSPEAVIPSTTKANTTVQYMLEVVYTVLNPETGGRMVATNWLESSDWSTPSWYSPLDYNATKGKNLAQKFAAYAILDEIAPGWAWINEANIFGTLKGSSNSDANKQFVEIAKPAEYGIKNWQLRLFGYKGGASSDPSSAAITTNWVKFGSSGVSSDKSEKYASANMTFMVVACPGAEKDKTLCRSSSDPELDETLDGTWSFQTTDGTIFKTDDTIGWYSPLGLQLVRPNGIVEHEIVLIGTNRYASYSEFLRKRYDPTNLVNRLNAVGNPANFFCVGSDDYGATNSLGVFDSRGEAAKWWNNTMEMTPGRINQNQYIDPVHPTPEGDYIMVYASVDTSFGHIRQTVGTGTNTTESQVVTIKRDSEGGLDIIYTIDPWCDLAAVKETDSLSGGSRTPEISKLATPRTYRVNVAKKAENNVTVVASATLDSGLLKYGIDERYRLAVLQWLESGTDAHGNKWYDWESGLIYPATFLALSGTVVTNLTLTQMYWLDMDPTVSNMFFRAGMARPPSQEVVWRPTYDPEQPQAITNLRVGIYMSISNGNPNVESRKNQGGKVCWPPYVLRGLAPGELSSNYQTNSAVAWTSVTFKVTGFLNNGLYDAKYPEDWIPLRYFIFQEDSFDANSEATIDIEDPLSTRSLAYPHGWCDWARTHTPQPPVWFSWNIDQRMVPVSANILCPTNSLYDFDSP